MLMAVSSADTETLLLPLLRGPPWGVFLRNLAKRTGADRVVMLVRPHGASLLTAMRFAAEQTDVANRDCAVVEALESCVSKAIGTLRHGRVYALEELLPAAPADQSMAPELMVRGDARIIRITVGEGVECWGMLLCCQGFFAAADGALLNSLGPFIAHAIRQFVEQQALAVRATAAEQILEGMGISYAVLDAEGKLLKSTGACPPVLPSPARHPAFTRQCTELVAQRRSFSIAVSAAFSEPALLRPLNASPEMATAAALLAVVRSPAASSDTAAGEMLRAIHGLSPREALLAWAIAQGESMLDAGARLGLTRETTRNYSKRIYAKTGTRGQADLARLCHTSLAAMA
jgi:DNA-binding CsgD family transcriptional regulator